MLNGWRLEAELRLGDHNPHNTIWEFTGGELTRSWESDKANNLEMLVTKGGSFDYTLKHHGYKMTLAVPVYAHNLGFKKGQQIQMFVINFFERSNTSLNPTPKKSIGFHDVEVLSVIPRNFDQIPHPSDTYVSYSEVLMKVSEGGVDYPQ
ncbi:MAG: hypothetical protein M3033_17055 [Acidobacteriota bacterium]|nr:hypothetical protein [Acidobacteriota bacterium]